MRARWESKMTNWADSEVETKSDDVDELIATIWRLCPWEGLSHGKTVSK